MQRKFIGLIGSNAECIWACEIFWPSKETLTFDIKNCNNLSYIFLSYFVIISSSDVIYYRTVKMNIYQRFSLHFMYWHKNLMHWLLTYKVAKHQQYLFYYRNSMWSSKKAKFEHMLKWNKNMFNIPRCLSALLSLKRNITWINWFYINVILTFPCWHV